MKLILLVQVKLYAVINWYHFPYSTKRHFLSNIACVYVPSIYYTHNTHAPWHVIVALSNDKVYIVAYNAE